MTTVVKDFVIDGRHGTYAQLDSGLWKFIFDDGEIRIARKTDDGPKAHDTRSSITEEVEA